MIGKIQSRRDNLHYSHNSLSTSDFRDSHNMNYTSNTSGLSNVLKETREQSKADSIGSPSRELASIDESSLKNL